MIDYERIGQRIAEERKFMRHKSQEQMAVELGMYQADISNLEHARKSSGINDLYKLEMIADYFDLPIENLLFGTSMEAHMIKYYGKKMELDQFDPSKKKNQNQDAIIKKIEPDVDLKRVTRDGYTCGPYTVQILCEIRQALFSKENNGYTRYHFFTFFNDTLIGTMLVSACSVFDFLNEKKAQFMEASIPPYVIDVKAISQQLNPYAPLLQYQDDDSFEEVHQQVLQRMDDLRPNWDRAVLLIESCYVIEDCRKHGICRMMMDILHQSSPGLIWLNMEPSTGEEMDSSVGYFPEYSVAEVGQINQNAVIAEKLGFKILSDTTTRVTKQVDTKGKKTEESSEIRKNAIWMCSEISEVVKDDAKVHAMNNAMKSTIEALSPRQEVEITGDIFTGNWLKAGAITAVQMNDKGRTVFAFKRGFKASDAWLGVSYTNPAPKGKTVQTIERYKTLEEAKDSRYIDGLSFADSMWLPLPDNAKELAAEQKRNKKRYKF